MDKGHAGERATLRGTLQSAAAITGTKCRLHRVGMRSRKDADDRAKRDDGGPTQGFAPWVSIFNVMVIAQFWVFQR